MAIFKKKPKEVGAYTGQQGPLGARKGYFFKGDTRPRAMQKQVFLAHFLFETDVARLALGKPQNALKRGLIAP